MVTKEELIRFEDEIKELYLAGEIRSPVHLSRGNEEQLIEIFENVKSSDWVFSTHRNHYHALLKGVDEAWLKNEILQNRSMRIHSAEHKFFTSSVVGGVLPIALGVALALKRKNSSDWVWVFVGDMAAEIGSFHECTKYAGGHNLPITFVVEDNSLSVNTPTREVWGLCNPGKPTIIRYTYERGFPHHGVGQWINF